MKVQHVDAVAHPAEAVRIAAEALLDGRVVVLPTDTVYGVAALPTDRGAVDELFIRKGRPADMLLAVLVADPDQARALAAPGTLPEALDALWPGPLTVVVERAAGADLHLGATSDTVGIRCPDHDLVRALAARVGPLATTSANRTGRPSPQLCGCAEQRILVPRPRRRGEPPGSQRCREP